MLSDYRPYTGVGSRRPPEKIGKKMTIYSRVLEQLGFTLRSGKAKGSDTFFENGVANPTYKEIFKWKDAQPWAFDRVKLCMPNDRPKPEESGGYDYWTDHVKGLLARNMMQVLGENGDSPSKFLVCWTPEGDYNTSKVGGTGYAIRCALQEGIPVYNLVYEQQLLEFEEYLKSLFRKYNNIKTISI
jgi:hypothetical protein